MPCLNLSREELKIVEDHFAQRARKAKLPKFVTRYQRISDKARHVLEALADPERNHARAGAIPAHIRGQDGNGVAKIIRGLREQDVAVVQAKRGDSTRVGGHVGDAWNVALLADKHMLFPPTSARELSDALTIGAAESEQFEAEDHTIGQGLANAA